MAIVLWCVAAIMLVSFGAGPVAGLLVAVPCALLAPGLVVVMLLRLRGLALNATVVLLVGLALGVLVPAAFLYAGAWSPRAAFAVIAGGTILGASAGIISDARRSHHSKGRHVPSSRRRDLIGAESAQSLSPDRRSLRVQSSSGRAEPPAR